MKTDNEKPMTGLRELIKQYAFRQIDTRVLEHIENQEGKINRLGDTITHLSNKIIDLEKMIAEEK